MGQFLDASPEADLVMLEQAEKRVLIDLIKRDMQSALRVSEMGQMQILLRVELLKKLEK